MGNCWKQKAKDYLWSIVGEPCGGKGSPSDIVGEMDAIHYYNYPKNGEADSCAILCDNAALHACTEPSYDEDPECAKYTALNAMYEPQSAGANAGAGCVQKIGYFKNAGEWYTDTSDFCELDEIFFWSSKYVSDANPYGVYHTGMIVDWGYIEELGTDGFTVIEGNTTYEGESGRVAYKYYAYEDPRILGAGRPNWDGWDPNGDGNDATPSPEPEPTPEPTPEPEPEPTPSPDRYEVTTNGGVLRLRAAPNTSSAYLIGIPNGTELEVTDIVEGESIDYVTDWARTCYAGYNGYVSCRWITKI